MEIKRSPMTLENGLLLPPDPNNFEYLDIVRSKKVRPDDVDRHHFYWPRDLYKQTRLSMDFREHRFNSVWVLRSEHDDIHRQYDGVPVPKAEVMYEFLKEARLLEEINISANAILNLNYEFAQKNVRKISQAEENKLRHLENIYHIIERSKKFELITNFIANIAISEVLPLMKAA